MGVTSTKSTCGTRTLDSFASRSVASQSEVPSEFDVIESSRAARGGSPRYVPFDVGSIKNGITTRNVASGSHVLLYSD